jgi:hypothetical protein
MEHDTTRMRAGRPWCFTNLRSGEGLEAVEAFLLRQLPPAGELAGQGDVPRAGC